MNRENEIIHSPIGTLLEDDLELTSFWSLKPEAYIGEVNRQMPAPKDKYVIIWLTFHRSDLSLDVMWRVLRMAIEKANTAHLLESVVGVEIVPRTYVCHEEWPKRILRLSFPVKLVDDVLAMKADALLEEQPIRGAFCYWYGKPDFKL